MCCSIRKIYIQQEEVKCTIALNDCSPDTLREGREELAAGPLPEKKRNLLK
jgi:hypothetical protein